MVQERRMLDEHFFLYNDVPDTGMWRQSDFRRAIQQQGCCLCEDKRKRLPRACRETYDGGSTYKGRGNCGVPHYVYGETGKVLTKRDITGEATDERYAAADQFLLEEGARSSFLTILAHDLMEENKIEMPMNMPFTTLPPSKGDLLLKYPRILETRVIINRPSDVDG